MNLPPAQSAGQLPGHLHLEAAQIGRLRQALEEFCGESEVLYTAILEESGSLCADAGDDSLRDSGETAALAVGAFAALQAVAARLGDGSFEGFFHEGKIRQFCLLPITSRFLLLSVFQSPVRLAVVKICAFRLVSRLQPILEIPLERGLSGARSGTLQQGTRGGS